MLIDKRAIKVLKALNKNNIEAYIVGGAVRDYLLNLSPSDYDICYNGEIKRLYEIFKGYKIYETGIKYGTVTLNYKGLLIELTRFRSEECYLDSRHPKAVNFVNDIKADLSRRDFTINAMCLDKEKNIVDIFCGKEDLENGVVKAVGNPDERFLEDALRILRAFRFASRFGFEIENKTKEAIFNQKGGLKKIAKERITEEVKEILIGANLNKVFFDFLKACEDLILIDGVNTQNALDILKRVRPNLRFLYFTLLFNREDAFRLSGKEQKYLNILKTCQKTETPNIYELFFNYEPEEISLVLEYFSLNNKLSKEAKTQCAQIFKKGLYKQIKKLKINGYDLEKLGLYGAEISKIKKELSLLILQNKIKNNKGALIKYVKEKAKW